MPYCSPRIYWRNEVLEGKKEAKFLKPSPLGLDSPCANYGRLPNIARPLANLLAQICGPISTTWYAISVTNLLVQICEPISTPFRKCEPIGTSHRRCDLTRRTYQHRSLANLLAQAIADMNSLGEPTSTDHLRTCWRKPIADMNSLGEPTSTDHLRTCWRASPSQTSTQSRTCWHRSLQQAIHRHKSHSRTYQHRSTDLLNYFVITTVQWTFDTSCVKGNNTNPYKQRRWPYSAEAKARPPIVISNSRRRSTQIFKN
jgi:hypothetical protein